MQSESARFDAAKIPWVSAIFNKSQNVARPNIFGVKNLPKKFQRASAVLAKVPMCTFVYAMSNFHVFARNAQQTDFCVFQCACLSVLG